MSPVVTTTAVAHVISPVRRWRKQLLKKTVGRMVFDHAREVTFGRLPKATTPEDRFIHILRSELMRTSMPNYSEFTAATAGMDSPVDRYQVLAFEVVHRDQSLQKLEPGQSYFLDFTEFIRVTWMLIQSCSRYPEKKQDLFRVYLNEMVQCDMPWYGLVDQTASKCAFVRNVDPETVVYKVTIIALITILLVLLILLLQYGCNTEIFG